MRQGLERTHCIPFMDILNRQFGLVIAYLLPGFIALAGIAPLVPEVTTWLRTNQASSIGAPLYALLAATAAGMVVNCFRWFIIDRLLVLTGVPLPAFNPRALEEHPEAINFLLENHYRFYQAYAGTLLAVIWTYSVYRWLRLSPLLGVGTDAVLLVFCVVLFAGSRDAIIKYRDRSRHLVAGTLFNSSSIGDVMTNGADHHAGGGNATGKKQPSAKPSAQPKSDARPETPAKPQPVSGGDKAPRH